MTEEFWKDVRNGITPVGIALKDHGLAGPWYEVSFKVRAHEDDQRASFRDINIVGIPDKWQLIEADRPE